MDTKDSLYLKKCPICDSDRIHYDFMSKGYPVYQCGDCNYIFLNPQPSDEILNSIYQSDYFINNNDSESDDSRTQMKIETAKIYINQLINYYGNDKGRLLEIGCGEGEFLSVAKEKGFEVVGIEVSEHSVLKANKKLGNNNVFCGTLENVSLAEKSFDICVLFDAIEHLRNPMNALININQLLKDDGVLFIVTPSLDSWSAKLMRNNWMEFKTEHLCYFDSQTIQNALIKTGFNRISITQNYKCLTFEYISNHFKKFENTFISRILSYINNILPAKLKRKKINIVASGINVFSRKKQINNKKILSIIVPVYNEKETFNILIESLIEKEIAGLEKEIIIVESNSTDGSRNEVLKYKEKSGIKIILEDKALGKGHAVRQGLKLATGDIIMIQDADLEYDLNDYEQLIEPIDRFQKAFVLGSRHSKGWKMRHFEEQPIMSLFMNSGHMFFTSLLNIFCWQKLKDPFTMYKIFRRDCIYELEFEANRFDFDWELVIKLLRKGYKPLEIPVNYNSRSFKNGKKVRLFRDPISWFWALVKFRFVKLYNKN